MLVSSPAEAKGSITAAPQHVRDAVWLHPVKSSIMVARLAMTCCTGGTEGTRAVANPGGRAVAGVVAYAHVPGGERAGI